MFKALTYSYWPSLSFYNFSSTESCNFLNSKILILTCREIRSDKKLKKRIERYNREIKIEI